MHEPALPLKVVNSFLFFHLIRGKLKVVKKNSEKKKREILMICEIGEHSV